MKTSAEKKVFIDELVAGASVCSSFVVRQSELRYSARSGAYALYRFADRTGELRGIQFDVAPSALLPEGSVAIVSGRIETSGRARRLKVASLALAERFDPTDFIAPVTRPQDEMQAEFRGYVRRIGDAGLRRAVSTVFAKGDTWEQFCAAPLSEVGVSARIGAALEHSLRLARTVDALIENHPALSGDLLLAGALLRHVGCVDAFTLGSGVGPSEAGAALGVATLSLYRVHAAGQEVKLPAEKMLSLESIVATSPPSSTLPEAVLLTQLDELERSTTELLRAYSGCQPALLISRCVA